MNKLFLLSLGCLIAAGAFAQDSTYSVRKDKGTSKKERINRMLRMEEEGQLIFNKQNIFGIKMATDGYGIFFEKGKFITPTKTRLIQFELNEKKSPKEYKISSGDLFGSSEVVGKLNNFYQFKVSYGQQMLIGGKGNKNGVAVTFIYMGGVSLGLQKPYVYNWFNWKDSLSSNPPLYQLSLLQALNDTANNYVYPPYSAAGFTKGWDHLVLKPGLSAKTALRFDYGRFNTTVTAIEAGLNAEYYFSSIAQMYMVPYKHFFFNGYVTIMFGGRK